MNLREDVGANDSSAVATERRRVAVHKESRGSHVLLKSIFIERLRFEPRRARAGGLVLLELAVFFLDRALK